MYSPTSLHRGSALTSQKLHGTVGKTMEKPIITWVWIQSFPGFSKKLAQNQGNTKFEWKTMWSAWDFGGVEKVCILSEKTHLGMVYLPLIISLRKPSWFC